MTSTPVSKAPITIQQVETVTWPDAVERLTDLIHAAVHAGASINFVMPFPREEAKAFWEDKVGPGVTSGTRLLWVATADDTSEQAPIVGTVQLDLAQQPNGPHRAEVGKLIVHPDWRRRGIARKLMTELEATAQQIGRTLLTLDTRAGDDAEPLYTSMGFQTVGIIPGFCLHPLDAGRMDTTTYMYKHLTQ